MFSSPFEEKKDKIQIPSNCDIVFVADMFTSDYVGGAELTTDALIDCSPYNVFRLHASDVSGEILEELSDKFWIFGNFSSINYELLPTIIGNIKYGILEYDYKYCKYRSPEKHAAAENGECDCNNQMHGKMISAFYYGAKRLWWMSNAQREIYCKLFPFLSQVSNEVLSSVFDEGFFKSIAHYAERARSEGESYARSGFVILGSESWIKGKDSAIEYCKKNNLDYELLWNLPYEDILEKLSRAEGFVYLPMGADTCPRMVIEAKMLGCNLILNEYVQHSTEPWFDTDEMNVTLSHLYFARERFWNSVKVILEYTPTISGYTTTLNCIRQNYPFEQSIESLLGFCDQVVVVDGGSDDGTWEKIQEIANNEEKVIVHRQERDWTHPRFAVFDGLQKALARALCTGEFCWQQDSDEIVHERDYEKIKTLSRQIPKNMDIIALPVVEFWGGEKKVRVDVNPWKWRFSRNRPHITHGIPARLRKFDKDGNLYSAPGTDGCDYIKHDTFESLPFASFYTKEFHDLRVNALSGDSDSILEYSQLITSLIDELPPVYHYSWFDIERKIKTYRDYWSTHWQSLYDIEQEDIADNNMFFNKAWSEISEEEISSMAKRLSEEMGGWIFHSKVDFSKKTPHIEVKSGHPSCMSKWIKK